MRDFFARPDATSFGGEGEKFVRPFTGGRKYRGALSESLPRGLAGSLGLRKGFSKSSFPIAKGKYQRWLNSEEFRENPEKSSD